jgi:dipeptidyl aminopeptidase/acylaminoacyl peptidase
MLDLARATAVEVPAIVRALADDGLADPVRVAAVGVSMGGYLVYHAVTVMPALRAVVALLGSPEWPDGGGPHRAPHAFRDVALLSITAEHDASVPPDAARRFHARLAGAHPDAPAAYHELRGAAHLMGAEHWAEAMDATLAWLRRHAR